MKQVAILDSVPRPLAALEHALGERGASALDRRVPDTVWWRALAGPAEEFLGRPGKELRAALVRAGSMLAGAGDTELPDRLALVVELLHAGSLVIDDVEDDSKQRRGGPVLHSIFGVPLAINTGSWMYFWSLAEIARLRHGREVREGEARARGTVLPLAARRRQPVRDVIDLHADPSPRARMGRVVSARRHGRARRGPGRAPARARWRAPVVVTGAPRAHRQAIGRGYGDKILTALEELLPDLRKHVTVRRDFTPVDFESELAAYNGSAFSVAPTLGQSAYFRPHNRDRRIPRLYLVGAGTHPGAGVPGVINGAKATCKLIAEDFGLVHDAVAPLSLAAGVV